MSWTEAEVDIQRPVTPAGDDPEAHPPEWWLDAILKKAAAMAKRIPAESGGGGHGALYAAGKMLGGHLEAHDIMDSEAVIEQVMLGLPADADKRWSARRTLEDAIREGRKAPAKMELGGRARGGHFGGGYRWRPGLTSSIIGELDPDPNVLGLVGLKRNKPKKGEEGDPPISGTLGNVLKILRVDRRWGGEIYLQDHRHPRLAYDKFAGKYQIISCDEDGVWAPREFRDADSAWLVEWLGDVYGLTVGVDLASHALNTVAEENEYDSLVELLDGFVWDGVPRLDGWLETYMKVRPNDDGLNQVYGRKWMVSAVARAYRPGCQADHALCLTGGQGFGKTACARILGFDRYHSDTKLRIGVDKDCYQQLRGVWIYELGEMETLSKREQGAVKEFITTRSDRYRESYARHAREYPRHNVFLGTTNEEEFLPEGGRRWWVRSVPEGEMADLESLARDVEQLWAEAVSAYKAGEPYHLEGEERDRQTADVVRYTESDPWEEKVAEFLLAEKTCTPSRCLEKACQLPVAQHDKAAQMRLARILRKLGWRKRLHGSERARVWVRLD